MPLKYINEIKVVAHRGASYAAPENTIPSFELAFKEGADFIEGDFWLTRDKEIVCIHDSSTYRVNKNRTRLNIKKSNLADLKNLDVGSWKGTGFKNIRIPTLQEVLQIIPEGKGIYIEIKDDQKEFVEVLFKILESSRLPSDNIKIISFDPKIIAAVKRHHPDIKTYWLFSWLSINKNCKNGSVINKLHHTIKTINCDGLNINAACNINEKFVEELLKQHLEFSVYNVDKEEILHNVLMLGANSITTNYPKKIREQIINFYQESSVPFSI